MSARYRGAILPANPVEVPGQPLQYPSGKTPQIPSLFEDACNLLATAPLKAKITLMAVVFGLLYTIMTVVTGIWSALKWIVSLVTGTGSSNGTGEDHEDDEWEDIAGPDAGDMELEFPDDYDEDTAEYTDSEDEDTTSSDSDSDPDYED